MKSEFIDDLSAAEFPELSPELLPLPEFELKSPGMERALKVISVIFYACMMIWIAWSRNSQTIITASILSIITAMIALWYHIRKFIETQLVHSGYMVKAQIYKTEVHDECESDRRYVFYRFIDPSGRVRIGEALENDDLFHKGDKIEILYDPNYPERNYLLTGLTFYQPTLTIYKRNYMQ